MNKPIKYPLAKLLKEKGFTEQVNNYFGDNGKEEIFQPKYTGNYNSHVMVGLVTSRPNLIDVIMWIYEKHGIWINVSPCMTFKDGNLREYEETSFSFMYSIKYGTKELFLKNSNELI